MIKIYAVVTRSWYTILTHTHILGFPGPYMYTIIFQTAWHFASARGLKFSHDDHNKDNDWMKLAYQTKIKQYNDQSHLVCVENGFVANKTHTSITKTVYKKSIWKCNVIYIKYYSNGIAYRCLLFLVFRRYFIVGNTHRTHTDYDWSVYWLTFCLICKFHYFWISNRYLFRIRRVKIYACSLKRSVTLLRW